MDGAAGAGPDQELAQYRRRYPAHSIRPVVKGTGFTAQGRGLRGRGHQVGEVWAPDLPALARTLDERVPQ